MKRREFLKRAALLPVIVIAPEVLGRVIPEAIIESEGILGEPDYSEFTSDVEWDLMLAPGTVERNSDTVVTVTDGGCEIHLRDDNGNERIMHTESIREAIELMDA